MPSSVFINSHEFSKLLTPLLLVYIHFSSQLEYKPLLSSSPLCFIQN